MTEVSDAAQRSINTASRAQNGIGATPDVKILADAIIELARAVKALDTRLQEIEQHPALG